MKKLFLSAAVIAASSAYVAYENYGAQASNFGLSGGAPAVAYTAPASLDLRTTAPILDQAPALVSPDRPPTTASLPPAQSKSIGNVAPAASTGGTDSIGATIAYATPTQPLPPLVPTPVRPSGAPTAKEAAAPVVPLPRPRPVEAPQVAVASDSAAPTTDVLPTQQVAATQSVAQVEAAYRNGTYKGVSADAYYGRVQVEAIISSGRLTSVKILSYPNDRGRSRYIASQSLPVLEQEAISAQSADIDTVSGATLTSEAFVKSLDSALSAALGRGSNA